MKKGSSFIALLIISLMLFTPLAHAASSCFDDESFPEGTAKSEDLSKEFVKGVMKIVPDATLPQILTLLNKEFGESIFQDYSPSVKYIMRQLGADVDMSELEEIASQVDSLEGREVDYSELFETQRRLSVVRSSMHNANVPSSYPQWQELSSLEDRLYSGLKDGSIESVVDIPGKGKFRVRPMDVLAKTSGRVGSAKYSDSGRLYADESGRKLFHLTGYMEFTSVDTGKKYFVKLADSGVAATVLDRESTNVENNDVKSAFSSGMLSMLQQNLGVENLRVAGVENVPYQGGNLIFSELVEGLSNPGAELNGVRSTFDRDLERGNQMLVTDLIALGFWNDIFEKMTPENRQAARDLAVMQAMVEQTDIDIFMEGLDITKFGSEEEASATTDMIVRKGNDGFFYGYKVTSDTRIVGGIDTELSLVSLLTPSYLESSNHLRELRMEYPYIDTISDEMVLAYIATEGESLSVEEAREQVVQRTYDLNYRERVRQVQDFFADESNRERILQLARDSGLTYERMIIGPLLRSNPHYSERSEQEILKAYAMKHLFPNPDSLSTGEMLEQRERIDKMSQNFDDFLIEFFKIRSEQLPDTMRGLISDRTVLFDTNTKRWTRPSDLSINYDRDEGVTFLEEPEVLPEPVVGDIYSETSVIAENGDIVSTEDSFVPEVPIATHDDETGVMHEGKLVDVSGLPQVDRARGVLGQFGITDVAEVKRIGYGQEGDILVAYDSDGNEVEVDGNRVVIKMTRPGAPRTLAPEYEAGMRIYEKLSSQGIGELVVRHIAYSESDDALVMEFVEGRSLRQQIMERAKIEYSQRLAEVQEEFPELGPVKRNTLAVRRMQIVEGGRTIGEVYDELIATITESGIYASDFNLNNVMIQPDGTPILIDVVRVYDRDTQPEEVARAIELHTVDRFSKDSDSQLKESWMDSDFIGVYQPSTEDIPNVDPEPIFESELDREFYEAQQRQKHIAASTKNIVASDIHGRYAEFKKFVETFASTEEGRQFEAEGGKYMLLGDYFDYYQDGLALSDYVVQLAKEGKAEVILGNHDVFFIKALEIMRKMYVESPDGNYLVNPEMSQEELDAVMNEFLEFVKNTRDRAVLSPNSLFASSNLIEPAQLLSLRMSTSNVDNKRDQLMILFDGVMNYKQSLPGKSATLNEVLSNLASVGKLHYIDDQGNMYMHGGVPLDENGPYIVARDGTKLRNRADMLAELRAMERDMRELKVSSVILQDDSIIEEPSSQGYLTDEEAQSILDTFAVKTLFVGHNARDPSVSNQRSGTINQGRIVGVDRGKKGVAFLKEGRYFWVNDDGSSVEFEKAVDVELGELKEQIRQRTVQERLDQINERIDNLEEEKAMLDNWQEKTGDSVAKSIEAERQADVLWVPVKIGMIGAGLGAVASLIFPEAKLPAGLLRTGSMYIQNTMGLFPLVGGVVGSFMGIIASQSSNEALYERETGTELKKEVDVSKSVPALNERISRIPGELMYEYQKRERLELLRDAKYDGGLSPASVKEIADVFKDEDGKIISQQAGVKAIVYRTESGRHIVRFFNPGTPHRVIQEQLGLENGDYEIGNYYGYEMQLNMENPNSPVLESVQMSSQITDRQVREQTVMDVDEVLAANEALLGAMNLKKSVDASQIRISESHNLQGDNSKLNVVKDEVVGDFYNQERRSTLLQSLDEPIAASRTQDGTIDTNKLKAESEKVIRPMIAQLLTDMVERGDITLEDEKRMNELFGFDSEQATLEIANERELSRDSYSPLANLRPKAIRAISQGRAPSDEAVSAFETALRVFAEDTGVVLRDYRKVSNVRKGQAPLSEQSLVTHDFKSVITSYHMAMQMFPTWKKSKEIPEEEAVEESMQEALARKLDEDGVGGAMALVKSGTLLGAADVTTGAVMLNEILRQELKSKLDEIRYAKAIGEDTTFLDAQKIELQDKLAEAAFHERAHLVVDAISDSELDQMLRVPLINALVGGFRAVNMGEPAYSDIIGNNREILKELLTRHIAAKQVETLSRNVGKYSGDNRYPGYGQALEDAMQNVVASSDALKAIQQYSGTKDFSSNIQDIVGRELKPVEWLSSSALVDAVTENGAVASVLEDIVQSQTAIVKTSNGKSVLISNYLLDHIKGQHENPGTGSVFARVPTKTELSDAVQGLIVEGSGGVFELDVDNVGYDLVYGIEEARALRDAREITTTKQERGNDIEVPLVETSLPMDAFSTDTLSLVIRPTTNPDYLPADVKADVDVLSEMEAGNLYSVLTSWPGRAQIDGEEIPPASAWGGKYAVISPERKFSVEEHQEGLEGMVASLEPVEPRVKMRSTLDDIVGMRSSEDIVRSFYEEFYGKRRFDPTGTHTEEYARTNPRNVFSSENLEQGLAVLTMQESKKDAIRRAFATFNQESLDSESSIRDLDMSVLEETLLREELGYDEVFDAMRATLLNGRSQGNLEQITDEFVQEIVSFDDDLSQYKTSLGLSENTKHVSFLGDAELIFLADKVDNQDSSSDLAYIGRLQMMTSDEREVYYSALDIDSQLSELDSYRDVMDIVEKYQKDKTSITSADMDKISDAMKDPELRGLVGKILALGIYNPYDSSEKRKNLDAYERTISAGEIKVDSNNIKRVTGFYSWIATLLMGNGETLLNRGLVYRALYDKENQAKGIMKSAFEASVSDLGTPRAYDRFQREFTMLVKERMESDPAFKERAEELYNMIDVGDEDVVFIDSGFKGTIPLLFAAMHNLKYPDRKAGVFLFGVLEGKEKDGVYIPREWEQVVPHHSVGELGVWKLEEAGRFIDKGGFDAEGMPLIIRSDIGPEFRAEVTLNSMALAEVSE